MPWLDNIFVARDGSLFTVLDDGTVEIRGPGWSRRRKRGDPPGADRPRICKLGSVARARRIVEMVNEITNKTC